MGVDTTATAMTSFTVSINSIDSIHIYSLRSSRSAVKKLLLSKEKLPVRDDTIIIRIAEGYSTCME